MTIVSSSAADGFIQRLPKDLRFYLVHGADEGLTHERSKAIVGKALDGDMDPLRVVRLEGDAIARDPGVLADEAYAIPMFGGAARSGSTRRDATSCRRWSRCSRGRRAIALSSSRRGS